MRYPTSYPTPFVSSVIVLILLFAPGSQAQSADSASTMQPPMASLQFQLLRNLGVYYIGAWGPSSFFRIGADASYSNSTTSGTSQNSNAYSGSTGSSSTGAPDNTSTSFGINISGLWVQTLAEYAHTSLYFGAGPLLSYGGNETKNASTTKNFSSPTVWNSTTSSFDDKSKSWGAGPLLLLGVRARIVGPVSVTAEMSAYAIYQQTTTSYINTTTSTDMTGYNYVTVYTSSGDSHGWSIALNNIAIGVAIEL